MVLAGNFFPCGGNIRGGTLWGEVYSGIDVRTVLPDDYDDDDGGMPVQQGKVQEWYHVDSVVHHPVLRLVVCLDLQGS